LSWSKEYRRRLTRGSALYAGGVVDAQGARVRNRGDSWQVAAPEVGDLANLVIASMGGRAIRAVRVRIEAWKAPKGWIGSAHLAGLTDYSLRPHRGGVEVTLAVLEPVDPGLLLAAALRMLRPSQADTGSLLTFAPGLASGAASLATAVTDIYTATSSANSHLRRCDTLVVPAASTHPEIERARTVVVGASGWTVDGEARDVVVDPAVHRPVGRRSIASGVVAAASVVGDTLQIETVEGPVQVVGDLTAPDLRRLKAVSGVRVTSELPVRWRAQLEAAGVVAGFGDFPASDDSLGWQAASVHARRHALRWYTPAAALGSWPSVSVILITHRDTYLDHALAQLAKINYPGLQVVIALHGIEVSEDRFAGLRGLHDVVTHRIDGSVPFGQAMQEACNRADGTLIAKVDDDDHYSSEHVWDLVLARMYSGAQLVGKALDWIHIEGSDVTAFRPVYPAESYSTFVAGGTMLISKADLASVGGWRPVPKSIDRALIEQVKRDGGLIYRTHGLGYIYVRHAGEHTAIVRDEHFLTENAQQWPGLIAHEAFGTIAT
jgi:hypothetical protein